MRLRPTRAEIDLAALRHNVTWLKRQSAGTYFCPMVKANAYGHGAVLVAKELESLGIDALGVALIEEGLELRAAGVQSPILIFAPFSASNAVYVIGQNLTPVLSRFEDLAAFDGAPAGFAVHLKFNTGMQRLGFDEDDLPRLREILKSTRLSVSGVCTHLSHGEDAGQSGDTPTNRQRQKFAEMTNGFPGVRHVHKSASVAACATDPEYGVRPGISLYGLAATDGGLDLNLRPVMGLRTQLTHIHQVAAGETAGYGGHTRVKQNSLIGVVPIGYADGYSRRMGQSGAYMRWRGQNISVLHPVCMDYTLLDLTSAVRANPADGAPRAGEDVTVIGDGVSAEHLAGINQTIPYEIVTAISHRVPREAKC